MLRSVRSRLKQRRILHMYWGVPCRIRPGEESWRGLCFEYIKLETSLPGTSIADRRGGCIQ